MPSRAFQPQFASGFNDAPSSPGRLRDIAWDRPLFRPPLLPNPRVVFDPLPYRTQLFGAIRQVRRLAGR